MNDSWLIIGDARHARDILGKHDVDLVATGPPYWSHVNYSNRPGDLSKIELYSSFISGIGRIWESVAERLKPGGMFVFWVHDILKRSKRQSYELVPLHADLIRVLPKTVKLRQIIIWDRYLTRSRSRLRGQDLTTRFQYIIIAQKAGRRFSQRQEVQRQLARDYEKPIWRDKLTPKLLGSSRLYQALFKLREKSLPANRKPSRFKLIKRIISNPAGDTHGYQTACPLILASRVIGRYSQPGDTVLDPFCGTGTTLLAARQLERSAIGIDINPKVTSIVKSRVPKVKITSWPSPKHQKTSWPS